eukprot:m.109 g.109  ORF g.109 m.109 type:complete len:178 (+) comp80_c0_seq1:58-591(+)
MYLLLVCVWFCFYFLWVHFIYYQPAFGEYSRRDLNVNHCSSWSSNHHYNSHNLIADERDEETDDDDEVVEVAAAASQEVASSMPSTPSTPSTTVSHTGTEDNEAKALSNNEIIHILAKEYSLEVQPTVKYLSSRFDAHLETREKAKNFILDCTHWCAHVFDVFEDTMLAILMEKFPF